VQDSNLRPPACKARRAPQFLTLKASTGYRAATSVVTLTHRVNESTDKSVRKSDRFSLVWSDWKRVDPLVPVSSLSPDAGSGLAGILAHVDLTKVLREHSMDQSIDLSTRGRVRQTRFPDGAFSCPQFPTDRAECPVEIENAPLPGPSEGDARIGRY
jgi:hypothetical protein